MYKSEVHQIYSPQYFGEFGYSARGYPNNIYCIWNVSDTGLVRYHIVDQQLQKPTACDKTGCDCPDSVKIKMGYNQIRLCGSDIPAVITQLSNDGLQVTFCSDNAKTAKGFHLLAYVLTDTESVSTLDINKRETAISEVGYNNHQIICNQIYTK